jgi:hypothetical protein
MEKVTDPLKVVTDPVVLKRLEEQGRDHHYVEFYQDYALSDKDSDGNILKGKSPYMKRYRDLASSRQWAVITSLPKVNTRGEKCDCSFKLENGKYISNANHFEAEVDTISIAVTCINDQLDGRKTGDTMSWYCELYLDGVKQTPDPQMILTSDAVPSRHKDNIIETSYEETVRQVRTVEGRLREWWSTYYRGLIEIEHYITGNMRLCLGDGSRNDLEPLVIEVIGNREIVDTTNFPDEAFPVLIGASPETFNPDAGTGGGNTTVDGWVQYNDTEVAWTTALDHAGSGANDTAVTAVTTQVRSGTTSNKFTKNYRGIYTFDTSALPDDVTITGVVFSLLGQAQADGLSISGNLGTNIYSAAPASDNALVAGDYDSLGTTAYCDTEVAYGDFGAEAWDDWIFNATGIAAVSKTGITKIGTRSPYYDIARNVPSWTSEAQSYIQYYTADTGGGKEPKLVVTYTSPWSHDFSGITASTISKIDGVDISNIAKINNITS